MSSLRTGQYFGNACRQIEAPGTVFTELRHARQRSLPFHTHQSAYFSMLLKGGYEEWYLGHTRSYLLNELFFHPDDFGHHDRITTPDTLLLCIAMSRSFQDSMRTRFSEDDGSPRLLRGKSVMIALTMRELLNPGLVPDPIALEEYALELLAAVNQWRSPAESVEPGWLRRSLEILHGSVQAGFRCRAWPPKCRFTHFIFHVHSASFMAVHLSRICSGSGLSSPAHRFAPRTYRSATWQPCQVFPTRAT